MWSEALHREKEGEGQVLEQKSEKAASAPASLGKGLSDTGRGHRVFLSNKLLKLSTENHACVPGLM
jgi:hypothetical protein